jgi:transposase
LDESYINKNHSNDNTWYFEEDGIIIGKPTGKGDRLIIDKIAREAGHSILRTPPYHPELQPIETCWAIVKNYVAQHNDCTMKKMLILLEEGLGKVTKKICQKLIEKINLQEKTFWNEDTIKTT